MLQVLSFTQAYWLFFASMLERYGHTNTSQLGGLGGSLLYCSPLPADFTPNCAVQGYVCRAVVGCMQYSATSNSDDV